MSVLTLSCAPGACARNSFALNAHYKPQYKIFYFAVPALNEVCRQQRALQTRSVSSGAAAPYPEEPEKRQAEASSTSTGSASDQVDVQQPSGIAGWWRAQQLKGSQGRAKLAALGLAAVLAYGLFDGVSYTIAFTIAFLGYEARTGLNPTQNVADLVKICILMWAGNNVTRPFRIAGAAALAPFMDRVMEGLRKRLRLPSKFLAFLLLVAVVAGACLSVVGALFLSRWVKG